MKVCRHCWTPLTAQRQVDGSIAHHHPDVLKQYADKDGVLCPYVVDPKDAIEPSEANRDMLEYAEKLRQYTEMYARSGSYGSSLQQSAHKEGGPRLQEIMGSSVFMKPELAQINLEPPPKPPARSLILETLKVLKEALWPWG